MDSILEKKLDSLLEHVKQRARERQAQTAEAPAVEPDVNQATEVTAAAQPMRQVDLFHADLSDPCPRDQQDLMAIPFFSLEKGKRTKPIEYQQDGVKVTVAGLSTVGIATIWDADFLIWVAAQLNAAVERGEIPTRRLWVVPYQFLRATGRIKPKSTGSGPYERFKDTLRRLQGTTVETTIKAADERIAEAWSWIDRWRAHEDQNGRMIGVEIILSEWFFRRVVKDRSVLAIHPDYFMLTGGIERWLYRLARKHCGNSMAGWSFTLRKLYDKYPPGREFRFFKRDLKAVVERDCLPEYHTVWETANGVDWVHFHLRQGALAERRLPQSMRAPTGRRKSNSADQG